MCVQKSVSEKANGKKGKKKSRAILRTVVVYGDAVGRDDQQLFDVGPRFERFLLTVSFHLVSSLFELITSLFP